MQLGQKSGHPRKHLFSGSIVGTADEDEGISRDLLLLHHHDCGEAADQLPLLSVQILQLPPGLVDLGGSVLVEEAPQKLVRLGLAAGIGGQCGGLVHTLGQRDYGHFSGGQDFAVDPNLIDPTGEATSTGRHRSGVGWGDENPGFSRFKRTLRGLG